MGVNSGSRDPGDRTVTIIETYLTDEGRVVLAPNERIISVSGHRHPNGRPATVFVEFEGDVIRDDYCDAESIDGYCCTEPADHPGDHVASDTDFAEIVRWSR